MSFAQDTGYIPKTIDEVISEIRVKINEEFETDYTEETFLGTNWYRFAYAVSQKIVAGEVRTSEIFLFLQQYIAQTNEAIQEPSVTYAGMIKALEDAGFVPSIRPAGVIEHAGTLGVCVDLDSEADDYDEKSQEVADLIGKWHVAGVFLIGDVEKIHTISNGQSIPIKFALPNRIPVLLKLTITKSLNTLQSVPTDTEIRQKVWENLLERYRLGLNFEPQRYYGHDDAPWAGEILLEYSDDDGANWESEIFLASYVDLFEFGLEDIAVVVLA
jgi:hypothetical protein